MANIFSNNPTAEVNNGGYYFQIGRVKSIVMGPYKTATNEIDYDYTNPADVGKIRYELLYSSFNISFASETTEPAYPIFNFIKQYPVINEIVLIIAGPSEKLNDRITNQQFYYFPAYNIWNHPNHGAFPNLQEYYSFLESYSSQAEYQSTELENPSLSMGNTFYENDKIKNLQPFEGDIIFQGRFGQSIRLGSTVIAQETINPWSVSGTNGDPITIITNKVSENNIGSVIDNTLEDINRDGASIYMTSTQEIFLDDINNFPRGSFKQKTTVLRSRPIIKSFTKPISTEILSAQEQDSRARENNLNI